MKSFTRSRSPRLQSEEVTAEDASSKPEEEVKEIQEVIADKTFTLDQARKLHFLNIFDTSPADDLWQGPGGGGEGFTVGYLIKYTAKIDFSSKNKANIF